MIFYKNFLTDCYNRRIESIAAIGYGKWIIDKSNKDTGKKKGDIGIAAPVYGNEVPPMVKDFLKNRHGGAAELAKKLCDECGIPVHYINVIMMADNWLPGFDMNEQKKIDKKIEEHMEVILADLAARRNMISAVTDTDRAAHQQFPGPGMWQREHGE